MFWKVTFICILFVGWAAIAEKVPVDEVDTKDSVSQSIHH